MMKRRLNDAVIWDVDGTIIHTTELHRRGWEFAAGKYGVHLTTWMLIKQSGMPNADAAKMMLGSSWNEALAQEFIMTKENFVIENLGGDILYRDFLEAVDDCLKKKLGVGICTSASLRFMEKVFETVPELACFKDRTVYREMYVKGKPDPEPLLLTAKMMGLDIWHCLYVGDAYNDYLAALRAGCGFVHFCRTPEERDKRIPLPVLTISDHREIANLPSSRIYESLKK